MVRPLTFADDQLAPNSATMERMEPTTQKHIESREGVCGGKPCIAGTRIRVWDIYVCHEVRGMTPDEIVAQYPQISLADVHAAMAYYWDNREGHRQADERS